MNCANTRHAKPSSYPLLFGPSRYTCSFGGIIAWPFDFVFSSILCCKLPSNLNNNTMRIFSYNVNGIRAAITKGFIDWLKTDPADIICVQETKAEKGNVDHKPFNDIGYQDYWFSAQKKGYSGVAVFTRIKPDHVEYGTGHKVSDDEGRVIQLDFGDTRLINAYFPSGTTGDERQSFKYVWLD